ncbi:MAG: hypothetical protein LIO93_12640 [Bacteroidales bacterium]|nr:hypothetical protein [Bacteroidales bacterium]
MNLYSYKDLEVGVANEPDYTLNSTDNIFCYTRYYFGEGSQHYPVSKHGIKVYQDKEIINSCLVVASGGATDIHERSSLIDSNKLLICCCNTLFNLSLPTLNLNWKKQVDDVACFQIFKLEDDYIIHGELLITRISKDGIIKWQFGGKDIFVSIDNKESFKLKDGYIELRDFGDTVYKLSFDGKAIIK